MNINSPLLVPKPQLKRDRATPYLNFSPKFWYSVCQANYRELPLNALILLGLITSGISVAWADWTSIAQGTGFYTDDVGIFSATRRLTRDGDPTQPALDSKLVGQGSDFVFGPMAEVSNAFDHRLGKTTLDLQGSGFIYADNPRYNHGTLRVQAKQAFTPETALLFRYYYAPDLFLGDNEERQTGKFLIVGEQVTSHIWSTRLTQELTKGLEVKLLGRDGLRNYNQAYSERNINFWTIGPHLEWKILPAVKLGLAYHYERGLADGRNQPKFEDDVSYINHYGSVDFDVELTERLTLMLAFHYERNNWTSSLIGDERNGAYENVYQGEALIDYPINAMTHTYFGVQHSRRRQNFEAEAAVNTNVGLGLTATF